MERQSKDGVVWEASPSTEDGRIVVGCQPRSNGTELFEESTLSFSNKNPGALFLNLLNWKHLLLPGMGVGAPWFGGTG